ncbi:MAG TPA: phosphopantothenoylcysteine decarboxylase [Planctomycetes bacterium]|nr:phosphopantothenoylcysteine decarboxylase [Planctomycetota bacterium]HIJ70246.1 phosphopantothenoylcysteine decarboxylase [Planctomycetota bacterium]
MEKTGSGLADVNILLGVTGGVAAYKAVDLASRLTAAGAKVDCILTENARRLIRPKSFEAVTGRAVHTSLWTGQADFKIDHIALAGWADIVVVAPATANIIAKIANGICDDLLSTTLCACWDKPVLLAPAMNSKMWANLVVQKNIETIKQIGFKIIGPETGRLACGTEGIGRMTEPDDILKEIEDIAARRKAQDT